jgi:predicted nuclease of predicted toxin-antitoxin system
MKKLSPTFNEIEHIQNINLHRASDQQIWDYALENDYTIVSKDSDFWEKAILEGPPPRVIWLQIGNCTTQKIHDLLINNESKIKDFSSSSGESLLVLSGKYIAD